MSADSGDVFKSNRKRDREDSDGRSKKGKVSKRDSDNRRSSRSSRKRSTSKPREDRPRRSERSSRVRSSSKERFKPKEKESKERSKRRSSSRGKSKRRSKSRSKSAARERSAERSAARERSASRERKRRSTRETRSKQRRHAAADGKPSPRSRSQDNVKSKNDSTDSDSLERPKSAMMKDTHPEYDPHEPMITSAFSEEDLRKSRDDVYGGEVLEYGNAEFDATKSFTIDTDIELQKYPSARDKASEAESDQEPSSTVDNSAATVWNGCINMVDVARFYVAAHEVSGLCTELEGDLSAELDIVGRINPATVWEYIGKMRRSGTKDIVLLRLQAANDEERMQYIALYSYLSTRKRLGVVKVSNTITVKDIYIVPLPASAPLPGMLLPLDGPGLEEPRGHLLIAVVIRHNRKRAAPPSPPADQVPAKVSRASRKRSYTPPPLPAAAAASSTLQPPYTSPALSTSVKDKIAATLASAMDSDEAYSPGSPGSAGSGGTAPALRSRVDELNRQIEEQKQQIMKMAQADSSVNEEDEAYSPSRPMTPSPPAVSSMADIALPSNLQEILATIKQRSGVAARDTDMRQHN